MMVKRLIIFSILASLLVTTGLGCKGGSSEAQQASLIQIDLEYWRVFDDSNALDDIIAAYRTIHPNVNIKVKKMRFDEYEDELILAFAEGRGPDIFSIHNTWLGKYQTLITPMPETVTLVYNEEQGTLKKEIVPVIREQSMISIRQAQTNFVDVVSKDVIQPYQADNKSASEERIWGLPYSMDTLALFYNKDLLNNAGIAQPPGSWQEFQEDVQAITLLDLNGNIVQSGAALGTTENVERAFDIVSLLMMQNGTPMTSGSGSATFAGVPEGSSSRIPPALSAIEFYTDFANPVKIVYTWNEDQPNSFDAFANGTSAFFLGYSYHTPLLRAQSPKLNFNIAPVPQISDSKSVNYANYWIETVAKTSESTDYAWDFINFAADANQVPLFLEVAKKPTALRSLINTQLEDLDLSVFASQVLTAVSWYQGNDVAVAEEAVLDLVADYLTGLEKPEANLAIAQSKVNQTL
ncbi:MAG: extracellular solute-binding protein [Candidatus Uhrbacteria bacterium]